MPRRGEPPATLYGILHAAGRRHGQGPDPHPADDSAVTVAGRSAPRPSRPARPLHLGGHDPSTASTDPSLWRRDGRGAALNTTADLSLSKVDTSGLSNGALHHPASALAEGPTAAVAEPRTDPTVDTAADAFLGVAHLAAQQRRLEAVLQPLAAAVRRHEPTWAAVADDLQRREREAPAIAAQPSAAVDVAGDVERLIGDAVESLAGAVAGAEAASASRHGALLSAVAALEERLRAQLRDGFDRRAEAPGTPEPAAPPFTLDDVRAAVEDSAASTERRLVAAVTAAAPAEPPTTAALRDTIAAPILAALQRQEQQAADAAAEAREHAARLAGDVSRAVAEGRGAAVDGSSVVRAEVQGARQAIEAAVGRSHDAIAALLSAAAAASQRTEGTAATGARDAATAASAVAVVREELRAHTGSFERRVLDAVGRAMTEPRAWADDAADSDRRTLLEAVAAETARAVAVQLRRHEERTAAARLEERQQAAPPQPQPLPPPPTPVPVAPPAPVVDIGPVLAAVERAQRGTVEQVAARGDAAETRQQTQLQDLRSNVLLALDAARADTRRAAREATEAAGHREARAEEAIAALRMTVERAAGDAARTADDLRSELHALKAARPHPPPAVAAPPAVARAPDGARPDLDAWDGRLRASAVLEAAARDALEAAEQSGRVALDALRATVLREAAVLAAAHTAHAARMASFAERETAAAARTAEAEEAAVQARVDLAGVLGDLTGAKARLRAAKDSVAAVVALKQIAVREAASVAASSRRHSAHCSSRSATPAGGPPRVASCSALDASLPPVTATPNTSHPGSRLHSRSGSPDGALPAPTTAHESEGPASPVEAPQHRAFTPPPDGFVFLSAPVGGPLTPPLSDGRATRDFSPHSGPLALPEEEEEPVMSPRAETESTLSHLSVEVSDV